MSVSVTGIDHMVIRVRDLDAGEALYRRLGFSLTPRGFHAGRGSANHTAPLARRQLFRTHLRSAEWRCDRFLSGRGGPRGDRSRAKRQPSDLR